MLPFVLARADQPFIRRGLLMLLGMGLTFAIVATLAAVGGGWKENEGVALLAGGGRGAAVAVVLAACFDVSGLGLVDHRRIAENGAATSTSSLTPSASGWPER